MIIDDGTRVNYKKSATTAILDLDLENSLPILKFIDHSIIVFR